MCITSKLLPLQSAKGRPPRERIAATYELHEFIDEKREALEKWANLSGGTWQRLCNTLGHALTDNLLPEPEGRS